MLIINNVLNALGWNDEDFNPEERAGSVGFTDYLLSIDGFPRLIVEAKRNSHTFHIPRNRLQRITYPLRYLRNQFGSSLTEVLEQAITYGQENGVPYAVLTNGAEWVLVQIRLSPGFKNFDDLTAYYFGRSF